MDGGVSDHRRRSELPRSGPGLLGCCPNLGGRGLDAQGPVAAGPEQIAARLRPPRHDTVESVKRVALLALTCACGPIPDDPETTTSNVTSTTTGAPDPTSADPRSPLPPSPPISTTPRDYRKVLPSERTMIIS